MLDPNDLGTNLDLIEEIEKASLRYVTQAVLDFVDEACVIFANENDLQADIGEDISREALDRLGMPRIKVRLFGKVDYKAARYFFHPEFALRQALFVDSKAEKTDGQNTATIQTGQTSLEIRQFRSDMEHRVPGGLPAILHKDDIAFLTTTLFVKYNYDTTDQGNELASITLAALPNGLLQERYNPSPHDGIWLAGRNAPSRGEAFRVRISFAKLKEKARWRVQKITLGSQHSFTWDE
jgi:hypothetical protein